MDAQMTKRRSSRPRLQVATPRAQAGFHVTRREQEILDLLMEGCANKEIASRLGVSDQTIKNQLSTLYHKAGVGSRLELVLLTQRLAPNG